MTNMCKKGGRWEFYKMFRPSIRLKRESLKVCDEGNIKTLKHIHVFFLMELWFQEEAFAEEPWIGYTRPCYFTTSSDCEIILLLNLNFREHEKHERGIFNVKGNLLKSKSTLLKSSHFYCSCFNSVQNLHFEILHRLCLWVWSPCTVVKDFIQAWHKLKP